MGEIEAFEAENTLGALLDRAEQGEEIVITRGVKPVPRLVPIRRGINGPQAEAAARLRERGREFRAGSFDWKKLKTERDAGPP